MQKHLSCPDGHGAHGNAESLRISLNLLYSGLLISILVFANVQIWPLSGASAQAQPFAYPAVLIDGRSVGNLILGHTTLDQAVRMFPPSPTGYEGSPRPPRGFPVAKIGQVSPKPTLVYNPWMTLYLLFFDANQQLVIIVDGGKSKLRGLTQQEMLKQYPQLKEMSRDSLEYELQVEIQPCVTLMALFSTRDNTVGDIAYVFTYSTQAGAAAPVQSTSEVRSLLRLGHHVRSLTWLSESMVLASWMRGTRFEIIVVDLQSQATSALAQGQCPSLSPDRTRMAYVGGPAVRGDVWIMDLRTRDNRKLTDGLRVDCLAWSPDGRRIAVTVKSSNITGGDDIVLISAETGAGELVIPTTGATPSQHHPAWTPDGQRLVFATYRVEVQFSPLVIRHLFNRIDAFDLRERQRSELVRLPWDAAGASNLVFAPDGRLLLFESQRQIYLYAGGVLSMLTEGHAPAWHPDGRSFLFARRATSGDELYVMRFP